MDELLGFEVRPIQGVVVAVGEEVTFKEEDGKLLALNEDGEAFGVVPNRFAKSLHELTESGQGISAFVQSRSGGVPFIIVSRAKVTAVADSGAVKPELEEKSGEEKPNEEKPEQAVAADEAARDASIPVPPEEVSKQQTGEAEQASETPELPGDADEQNALEPEALPPQSSSGQTKKSKKISQDTAGLIFCCAFCVILVIVIAAWPCDHEWAEATCTEPATCIKCGETEGSALGHDWQEATCTEPKTCSRCGETRGDVSHTWVDATCTEPATCSRCGETDGEALGHTVEDWTVDVEATCTSEGSKSGTCTVCGEVITETIEMLDQVISNGEYSIEVPGGWIVGDDSEDDEDFSTYNGFSSDLDQFLYFQAGISISGTGSVDVILTLVEETIDVDASSLEQTTTEEGAVICRYDFDNGTYRGYYAIIFSGDTYANVLAYCEEDDFEEYSETLEGIVDSLTAENPSEPDFSTSTYSAGSYRVGKDIPAGEYKITCSGDIAGYYCVYTDTTEEDIVDNDNFTACVYVTLTDGQYIEVKRATFTAIEDADATTTLVGNGMYKVGFDLDAGEYLITADSGERGYYAIWDSSDVENKDILTNDIFEGSTYVTVSEGQYLEISRATAVPAD